MPSRSERVLLMMLSAVVLSASVSPATAAFDNPKAHRPPRAKPHRRSAGESLPPLPLPATPLRRSERKRQPAPPALIGMITFAGSRFVVEDGKRIPVKIFPSYLLFHQLQCMLILLFLST